ncbi:prolipoprotein diacylglyceryl transferase [Aurantibacillus circumpalustris]|uniref:prolipoprotein diacylglyceryl transferase n=1 Tax=Aurantibacillus circumpalustris TaxID=3036359 RepID=UPI00295C2578|nr:prolipoprotein diacylglyceryl transferase [Aurantibacillus circumpalustris]
MILNFITWNPAPEIFTIPGIDWPVRWYGLMWALAFIGSFYFMNKVYRKEGRTDKDLDTLTLYIIVGTILGARFGHCLFYGPWFDEYTTTGILIQEGYLSHPLNMLKIYEGGLASHGGAIGILTAMILYCRKTKENWLWLFDRLVIVVPLASMSIRLGNLINSEIIGKVTDVPWAFIFLQEDNQPRHPAQLYEAIYCFFLFIFMFWFWKNKRDTVGPGFMFGMMCVLLFIERFVDEFFKENQSAFEDSMALNMGQWLSIPFILVGIFMIIRSYKHEPNSYKRIEIEKAE